jgi:hypothetical protein
MRTLILGPLLRERAWTVLVFLVDLDAMPAALHHVESVLSVQFHGHWTPKQLLDTGRLITRCIDGWEL